MTIETIQPSRDEVKPNVCCALPPWEDPIHLPWPAGFQEPPPMWEEAMGGGDPDWDPALWCCPKGWSYDAATRTGRLLMGEGECCNAAGGIGSFTAFDHEVQCIKTYAGDVPDVEYRRQGEAWEAIDSPSWTSASEEDNSTDIVTTRTAASIWREFIDINPSKDSAAMKIIPFDKDCEIMGKLHSEARVKQDLIDDPRGGKREQKPPSRTTGAGTFMRSYLPISYTLDGVLPGGSLYGLTARQGTGKTAWMSSTAIAVAMNRPEIIGVAAVEVGRVAYVSIENPTDFKMKFAINCFVHGVSYDEIEPRVAIIDGRDTPEQIHAGLKLDAEKNGPFQLVCFDTFQAGFAAAGAGAFNDNEAVLGYVIRLRPLTTLPGSPSVLVAFHPTKRAGEDELIPYGGGSTFNEIDGNLTLWKEAHIKLHHNRVRGPEFEPKYFRIEMISSPDIVDTRGRQILLPVMRPVTEADAAKREQCDGNIELALLRAVAAKPDASQAEWGMAIGRTKSIVNRKLQRLKQLKLVEEGLGKWIVTAKGFKEVSIADKLEADCGI